MMPVRLSLLLVLGVLFLIDRFLKRLAVLNPSVGTGDFFYATTAINHAGPFSLSLPNVLLVVVAAAAFVWLTRLAYRAYQKNEWPKLFGAGLMLVGGFSNVWDRITVGGVIDIWQMALSTGLSFNLSDVYLVLGLVLVAWTYRRESQYS